MTREEEIHNQAVALANNEYFGGPEHQAYVEGGIAMAKWADKYPVSKYNMSDIDYIKSQINGIREDAEHITSGNITHNSNAIKMKCDAILKCFSKIDLLS